MIDAGLLLYWYFRSNMSTSEADALLQELEAEMKTLQMAKASQFATLPLVAAAEVLQETHLFPEPPTLSASLKVLIATINSTGT
ncbi:hypothetical protein MPH_13324 [Macrophomina phaseolina MS6]|uniref:Uncharacterized protein n=1 Tax=Macrophomina phaseolina (strain MS6) TaxID=1126212 RepID=K2QIK0_MACPH|nr:hypothetical protein MPH_13324 [Macrophomina phaseolina MS6]